MWWSFRLKQNTLKLFLNMLILILWKKVPPHFHVNRQAGGCFRQRQRFVPLVYYLTNYDDDDDFDDDGDEAFQFAWSKSQPGWRKRVIRNLLQSPRYLKPNWSAPTQNGPLNSVRVDDGCQLLCVSQGYTSLSGWSAIIHTHPVSAIMCAESCDGDPILTLS